MAKKLITRGTFLALAIALACGALHALPYLGASAQPSALVSAARGVAAEQGIAGFSAPTVLDKVSAFLWHHGREQSLALGQLLGSFLLWTLIALVVLGIAALVNRAIPHQKARRLITAAVIIALAASCAKALWSGYSERSLLTQDITLSTPRDLAVAAASQPPGSVFSTLSALPFLILYAPESTGPLAPATAASLAADPARWRDELRKSGWKAAVLAGPANETQPLLNHLLVSPDWRLASISNQGYLFLREKGPLPPAFDPEKVRLRTDRDTAVYLAQMAERLDALRRIGESRDAIAKALDYGAKEPEVLVRAASLHATHKRWQDAITYCDRALQIDSRHLYAHLLKALALIETGRPELAEREARSVMDQAANDPYTLFLYARISRSLHDYRTEAQTLEKLVDLTKASQAQVPANYYVFLGQAYAKSSDADNALRAYRAALAAPDLSPAMAVEVKDSVQTIERKK